MDSNPELLQSEYWARLKERHGWRAVRAHYVGVAAEYFLGTSVLLLERTIGPATIAYCGHGFALSPAGEAAGRAEVLSAVANVLREAKTRISPRSLFIRWDVPWPRLLWNPAAAEDNDFRPATIRVQPPDTVVLDIAGEPEQLLGAMKSKTRYNIRLAERKGVVVQRVGPDRIDDWYAVYQATAKRDRIAIHPLSYYQAAFGVAHAMHSAGAAAPELVLYLAEHEGDLLGGIVVAHWAGRATYLYGASSDIKRNYMASYLLQWHAIEGARRSNCSHYDFFGIPPTGDEAHPMHGLYRFKTGFGGAEVHRPGCHDLLRPGLAPHIFRTAERLRQWYYHQWQKRGVT